MGTWPPPQASPEGLTKEGGPEEAWGGRGFAIETQYTKYIQYI